MSMLTTPNPEKGEKRNISEVTVTSPESTKMEATLDNICSGLENSAGQDRGLLEIVLVSLQSLHKKFDGQLAQLEKDIHHPKDGLVEMLAMTSAETEDNTANVSDISSRVSNLEKQMLLMSELLTKKDKEIYTLKSEITDMRGRSMRDNIVITGIEEKEGENIRAVVNDLLTRIEVDRTKGNSGHINFDRIHRFGTRLSNGTRPIVAKLHDHQDKGTILDNANKLKKDPEAEDDGTPPVFINAQYPEEIAEKRRQIFAKVRANKRLPQHQQAKMNVSFDKLFINGELDKPAVSRPSPSDIIAPDQDELNKMEKLPVVTGEGQHERGNSFWGYAVKVKSLAETRRAYKKILRLPRNASASHVMCGYRLESNAEGSYDDCEWGGGGKILRSLQYNKKQDVAVFVVRHHATANYHLGPKRFQLINAAANSALERLT